MAGLLRCEGPILRPTDREDREVPDAGDARMTGAADWAAGVGDVWASEWRRTDRSFAALAAHLDAAILAAAPTTGLAVDLGCGAGQTSMALAAARPELRITGVDVSAELIQVAQTRAAERSPNLRFVRGDIAANAGHFAADADLLFSRHGVMFFDDPHAVFAALHDAARPGARLIFSCFRRASLNPWASEIVARVTGAAPAPANGYAPGPFGFADADWVTVMLTDAGWRDLHRKPIDYSYVAGEGPNPIADAASFFGRIGPVATAIRTAPEADRPRLRERLTTALAPHRQGDQVCFPAAAWLWSARASGARP